MRILISAIHYPISGARNLAEGFKRLGHDVITIGPATGGFIPWLPSQDFSAFAWTPTIAVGKIGERHFPFEYALVLAKQLGGKIDLVVQCDANYFLVRDDSGDYDDVPNVVWAIDNHVAKYDEVSFDVYFGAHSWGHGSQQKNFEWLPCAYDPQQHYPINYSKKEFDAAFIGVVYQNRWELFNKLGEQGKNKILIGMGVFGELYNVSYNLASIGICQSACGDVPHRVFENAAQGLALLCDRQKDLPKLGLIEGEDYLGYDNFDEALSQFHRLKDNPSGREWMAKNAQRKLASGTYENRARAILERVFGKDKLLQGVRDEWGIATLQNSPSN